MSLRDSLTSEKAKERYDKNYYSVETTFTQKELEEHDKEIRDKAIEEFAKKMKNITYQWFCQGTLRSTSARAIGMIDEIAKKMKEVGE